MPQKELDVIKQYAPVDYLEDGLDSPLPMRPDTEELIRNNPKNFTREGLKAIRAANSPTIQANHHAAILNVIQNQPKEGELELAVNHVIAEMAKMNPPTMDGLKAIFTR